MSFHQFIFAFLIFTILSQFSYAKEQAPNKNLENSVYGDWKVTCPENEICRMSQSIVTANRNTVILQVQIFKDETPTILFKFPLGILLNTGWQMKVDQAKAQLLPFEICRKEGCFSGLPLKTKILNSLKRGNKLNIKFFDAKQNIVEPKVSLKGFTKAYEYLSSQ